MVDITILNGDFFMVYKPAFTSLGGPSCGNVFEYVRIAASANGALSVFLVSQEVSCKNFSRSLHFYGMNSGIQIYST